jgi:hypothetical protein
VGGHLNVISETAWKVAAWKIEEETGTDIIRDLVKMGCQVGLAKNIVQMQALY